MNDDLNQLEAEAVKTLNRIEYCEGWSGIVWDYLTAVKKELRRLSNPTIQIEAYALGYGAGYKAAQPKWISVEERLPETIWPCIGYRRVMGTFSLVRLASNGRWMFIHEPEYASGITHWMPLPAAPKEEE